MSTILNWLDGKEEKLANDKVEEVNQLITKKEFEDCCICHSGILISLEVTNGGPSDCSLTSFDRFSKISFLFKIPNPFFFSGTYIYLFFLEFYSGDILFLNC